MLIDRTRPWGFRHYVEWYRYKTRSVSGVFARSPRAAGHCERHINDWMKRNARNQPRTRSGKAPAKPGSRLMTTAQPKGPASGGARTVASEPQPVTSGDSAANLVVPFPLRLKSTLAMLARVLDPYLIVILIIPVLGITSGHQCCLYSCGLHRPLGLFRVFSQFDLI